METKEWNFDEFLAFLLIYASHADIDFSREEEERIKALVSNEIFEDIYAQFNVMTDYQALETILSYKDIYFKK